MSEALLRGYATGGTDGGHDNLIAEEYDGKFIPGHPEKAIDYGYRAVHLMSVTSQRMTADFYGKAIQHRYYIGESRGGYEAITEANRFPDDYDAVAAGWPTNPFVLFNAQQIWANWLIQQKPERFIPEAKYSMIHEAVLEKCDAQDGLKDGIVSAPLSCTFEPKSLLCKGADAPDCLTSAQVELLEKTYEGPTNQKTGAVYYPGVAKGSEMGMFREASGEARGTPLDMYRYVVFADHPEWNWKKMDWDKDIQTALDFTRPMLLTPANFDAFVKRGGKMLLYCNWLNFHSPVQVAQFAQDAIQHAGSKQAADAIRVVTMVDRFDFDKFQALENWVEHGQAPEELLGTMEEPRSGQRKSRPDAGTANGPQSDRQQNSAPTVAMKKTRPVCAYPKAAIYDGQGDPNVAESFHCGVVAKP
jgi:feruloyl esterase